MIEPRFLNMPAGRKIAVMARPADGEATGRPGIIWLGGFNSTMDGIKASALDRRAAKTGSAFVRFDYSGHGASSGELAGGTIGQWLDEARAVFEAYAQGPQILVGSSMGGWIALLLARRLLAQERADALAGLVLIAPAIDMTDTLMWQTFPEDVRREIETEGVWHRPSAYGDGSYAITRALIEDGRQHLLGDDPIDPGCPVRILHGMQDPDVPHAVSLRLIESLATDDVRLTLIKDGDHRLSRPQDLRLLIEQISGLAEGV